MTKKNILLILLGFDVLKVCTSLATLIYFSIQLSIASNYDIIHEYREVPCIPTDVNVIHIAENCLMPTWYSDNDIAITENPFAGKISQQAANTAIKGISLNLPTTCLCQRSNTTTITGDCQVWSPCFFNTDLMKFMQGDFSRQVFTYISFIIGSLTMLVISLAVIPFSYKLYKREADQYIEL